MSMPPLNTGKMLLESSVTRVFNRSHRLAYAQIGPDLTILQTSDNFSPLLPAKIEKAEGWNLIELIDEFKGAEAQLRAVLNDEAEEYSLTHISREGADGAHAYYDFRVVNLQTLVAEKGLLLIIEDVTETVTLKRQLVQSQNELRMALNKSSDTDTQAKQLHQFRSFLISMLAHDLRTPLAAIRGYSELLVRLINGRQSPAIPAKAATFADNICNITDQMIWLIQDIIDLDRSEKGSLSVNLGSCDVHQVIQDTLDNMASIIKLQNITLTMALEPPDLLVLADSQRMRQITNNLIGNAIKYTPNGGEISIKTYAGDESAFLVVQDNGRGLTAEQTEKIFEPYYRTSEAKSSNILGSGLGLHIVKILVEAQDGRIEVVSEVGKGSTFTVSLPLF